MFRSFALSHDDCQRMADNLTAKILMVSVNLYRWRENFCSACTSVSFQNIYDMPVKPVKP